MAAYLKVVRRHSAAHDGGDHEQPLRPHPLLLLRTPQNTAHCFCSCPSLSPSDLLISSVGILTRAILLLLRSHSGPSAVRGPTEDDDGGGGRRGEELAAIAAAGAPPLTSPVRARPPARPTAPVTSGSLPIRRAGTNHVPVWRGGGGPIDDGEKGREVSTRCPLQSSYSDDSLFPFLLLSQQHLSPPTTTLRNCAAGGEPAIKSSLCLLLCEISGSHVGGLVIHHPFPESVDEVDMASKEGWIEIEKQRKSSFQISR